MHSIFLKVLNLLIVIIRHNIYYLRLSEFRKQVLNKWL